MKKICPICNEEFETNIPNKIYCSAYCSNKRRSLKVKDKEFHKVCECCGKETNLHVHHIIPRDEGGPHIPENLITLCGSCHRSVESGNVEKIIKKCLKALKTMPKGIHKII